MAEKKDEEIRINDRRFFDQEGNPVTKEESEPSSQTKEGPKTEKRETKKDGEPQPGIDFIAILFTFVHTCLIYLGEVKDPEGKSSEENLEGARQMIDILEIMQQKTKGNLTAQEEQYLESALYDLRMRYMKKAKLIQ
ncbi:DUF1844 domain-containing protein [bacterium]|nr:DUF1844 domain-containing protein [bacterium]